MSSGQNALRIFSIGSSDSNGAVAYVRKAGSTPQEIVRGHVFEESNDTYLDFVGRIENYVGGGLSIELELMPRLMTDNVARFGVAFRVWGTSDDIDSSHSYVFTDVDFTMPDAAGKRVRVVISVADGAGIDSAVNGDYVIMRVRREASHANDTHASDVAVVGTQVKEQ